ncbi:hypothetical protein EE612_029038, partial [Oryza sativa]
DGLKAALVLLPALDHPDAPRVPPTGHHHDISNIKLDEVHDLVGLQVNLDGVVGLDEWVWVADRAPVIGVQERNTLLSKLYRPDLAELELSVLILDAVETEATLGVIQKAEILPSLCN